MKQIIFDCDNTFGIPGCDVDDGLALLYLLGSGRTVLSGITTTYGNSTLETVDHNTRQMLRTLGLTEIPVMRGSAVPGGTDGQAAAFLCDAANRYPGELCILATGSLTNLYAAYRRDPTFFDKVSEVALMGGITAPLCINGKILNELNFSCDPEAALCVLTYAPNLKIATGNRCLDAFFSHAQCKRRLTKASTEFGQWLYNSIYYWVEREAAAFGHDGMYQWDVYAAACLLEPELFELEEHVITPTVESLSSGRLHGQGLRRSVLLPRIRDVASFTEHIYDVYLKNHWNPKGELENEG